MRESHLGISLLNYNIIVTLSICYQNIWGFGIRKYESVSIIVIIEKIPITS